MIATPGAGAGAGAAALGAASGAGAAAFAASSPSAGAAALRAPAAGRAPTGQPPPRSASSFCSTATNAARVWLRWSPRTCRSTFHACQRTVTEHVPALCRRSSTEAPLAASRSRYTRRASSRSAASAASVASFVAPAPQPTQTPNSAHSSFRTVCALPVSSEAREGSTPSSPSASSRGVGARAHAPSVSHAIAVLVLPKICAQKFVAVFVVPQVRDGPHPAPQPLPTNSACDFRKP